MERGRTTWPVAGALAALLATAACGGNHVDGGPKGLPAYVDPDDQKTLQLWPPEVRVDLAPGMSDTLDLSQADALARSVSLVTWPELEPLPARTAQGMMYPLSFDRGSTLVTFLRPDQPLDDRWYALRLANPPSYFDVQVTATTRAPDGTWLTRFRPGSDPRIRRWVICSGDAQSSGLRLEFTEHVWTATKASDFVTVTSNGALLSCDGAPMPAEPELQGLSLTCPVFDPLATLHVHVGPGIQAVDSTIPVPPTEVNLSLLAMGWSSAEGCATVVSDVTGG